MLGNPDSDMSVSLSVGRRLDSSFWHHIALFDSQHNNTIEWWDVDGRPDSEAVGIAKTKRWLEEFQQSAMDEPSGKALLNDIAKRSAGIPVEG